MYTNSLVLHQSVWLALFAQQHWVNDNTSPSTTNYSRGTCWYPKKPKLCQPCLSATNTLLAWCAVRLHVLNMEKETSCIIISDSWFITKGDKTETFLFNNEPYVQNSGSKLLYVAWEVCTEFNAQQPLFEALSQIIQIFDSVEPQTESIFLFQYNITFETYQSLEHPTYSGGRYTCAPTDFFVRNSMLNNFHLNNFWLWCVFLAASSPKLNLHSCFCT